MFRVLDKKKHTYATKANKKEAYASTTVFADSGITKSMVGTAFIAGFMNVDLPGCPLTLLTARDSSLSSP